MTPMWAKGATGSPTGEKQLISFARAVLADPAIFVLDEATSSIDTQTEQLIQNAISHLLKGRTSFLIAHRLSTIRHADVILVVKDGKIIESGSHEELLHKRGIISHCIPSNLSRKLPHRLCALNTAAGGLAAAGFPVLWALV